MCIMQCLIVFRERKITDYTKMETEREREREREREIDRERENIKMQRGRR